jgi:hypothetical protein
MVDVKSKRCKADGCTKGPAFNFEGETTGLYCATHKLFNMVDIKHKRCKADGCTKGPAFNFEGETTGLYCATHKLPNMVNVKSPRCEYNGCTTQPGFGVPGKPPTHCAQHKSDGMISHPKRRCESDDCKEYALYGMNSIPTHCKTHKSPQHMNLVQHDCVVCGVLEVVDNEKKCARCSEYLQKRLNLRKQRQVKSWIDTNPTLKNYESYDKQIESGTCGKERPDFVWDTPTHKVILEVDEFQHRDRPCECEQTRMVNVTQSFGMPCLWVRYNPDDFKGQKSSLKEQDRKDLLLRVLSESLSDAPENSKDVLRVKYLFFDGFKLGEQLKTEHIPLL